MQKRERKGVSFDDNGLAHFYFSLPLWERGVLVGLLTFALGLLLATATHLGGAPLSWTWLHESLLKNIVEGVVIGYAAYGLAWLRERRLEKRMKEIGYMNHHIRNALQAIELAAYQIRDSQERFKVVDENVKHIITTLGKISRAEDVALIDIEHPEQKQ